MRVSVEKLEKIADRIPTLLYKIVEAALRRQFISVRRPSRDSRYAASLCTHCAYTLFSHMCYNRYPPTCGFKYIVLYSTARLTVWLCRICLRHTGDRLYTQPKQTWSLPDIHRHLLISNKPLPRPPLPQLPPPPCICRTFTLIPRNPGSLS